MTNMGYCRFRNTLPDMRDCYQHLDEEDISDEEQRARRLLIILCVEIATEYGDSVGLPVTLNL